MFLGTSGMVIFISKLIRHGFKIVSRGTLALTRAASTKAAAGKEPSAFRKWCYNASGFNKLGLMHDDLLYEDEYVKEALRRLPEDLLHERTFRIVRAMQLSMTHDILPKEQWTKYEEDVKYLQPYLEEVRREKKEREEWESNH